MNKNQMTRKFLAAATLAVACFVFAARTQNSIAQSQSGSETDIPTVFTGDNAKSDENFDNFAPAATFTVNSTGDAGDANTADGVCATAATVCTLRAAVQQANAAAASDTITFAIPASDAGCAGGVCTITLTNGELSHFSSSGGLTITNATGANNLLISGNNASRIFLVSSTNLTLDGVTIINGNGTGTTSTAFNGFGGGIIQLGGTLTLTNSRVTRNSSAVRGGGIYAQSGATVTLTNSIVDSNTSSGSAGGISVEESSAGVSSTLMLTNSTVSNNTAQSSGGGILSNNNNTITLINSTVSGNASGSGGGGIFLNFGGTLNLTGVTVANNRSTSATCTTCAGGISNGSGTANLNNTIVAGNTAANSSSSPDFRGAISSTSSYNLIGNNQGASGITNGTNGNQVGTPTNQIDPRLEPLANNGGATQTHALMADSPAIDRGNSFGLTTDQRGLPRPVDLAAYSNAADGADIGAFELQNAAALSYEADVAPRPNGDGLIQSNDTTQVQRFEIGLDRPFQSNEFQRADSAPFNTRGDGVINAADTIQAQRYEIGLDARQLAEGPTAPIARNTFAAAETSAQSNESAVANHQRQLRVESVTSSAGQTVTVNIRVDSIGDEAGYGFTINFDPSVLTNPSVEIGTAGGRRVCNFMTAGQIACSVRDFDINQPGSSTDQIGEIPAGDNQILVRATFTVATNAQPGTTNVTLTNVNASNDLAQNLIITSQNGTVTITAPTAASMTISGKVTTQSGRGIRNVTVMMTDAQGNTRTTQTTSFGYYRFDEAAAGETYIISAKSKRYQFVRGSRIVNATENITEVNFAAADF